MLNLVLFLITAIFWGGSFIGIKYAIADINPIAAAMWRVLIGLVFMSVVLKVTGRNIKLPKKYRFYVWGTGILGMGVPFALLFWGEQSVSAGLAGIINGTTPIWTFLVGIFFLRNLESFTIKGFLGLAVGMVGVILVLSPTFSGSMMSSNSPIGALAVIGMAVSYATATVFNKRLMSGAAKIDVYANVFHQLLSSTIFLVILSIAIGGWKSLIPINAGWPSITASLYLGICSTGFALLVFYHLINKWGAVKTISITYIIPIVAVFLDYLIFNQVPHIIEIAGMFVIITAIAIIQVPQRKAINA